MTRKQEKKSNEFKEEKVMDLWRQYIHTWYPDLAKKTYFLPPLHFNRVPYNVMIAAGRPVLIMKDANGKLGPGSSIFSRDSSALELPFHHTKDHSKPLKQIHPRTVNDSDLRDDRAQERVLQCLRELADMTQEAMMVISQLKFGQYLKEPAYRSAASVFPHSAELAPIYRRGDFDILIIHSQFGLVIGEIKSVGANFSCLKMPQQQEDAIVASTVQKALKSLIREEVVLKHLVSDILEMSIIKILILPNITSEQLLRVARNDINCSQELCECMDVQEISKAVELCLCSDQMSGNSTFCGPIQAMSELGKWWSRLVAGVETTISFKIYQELVARFCGPATAIDIHSTKSSRIRIRTEWQGVSETGERMKRLVLYPKLVDILKSNQPKVVLTGPPGTGKTVVLILQAMNWLQQGHDVFVISCWRHSRAVSFFIEHELITWAAENALVSKVYLYQCDFRQGNDVTTAVSFLKEKSSSREQLCTIIDEAETNEHFTLFFDLLKNVPKVNLWVAIEQHAGRQTTLTGSIMLTIPIRCPPVVTREIQQAIETQIGEVHTYSQFDGPFPTDGPKVKRITHASGQSEHTGQDPRDCIRCGSEIARYLKNLNIGSPTPDINHDIPILQYSDVFIICDDPRDDVKDSLDCSLSRAICLVQGLRSSDVPVRVIETTSDDVTIREMALAKRNEVIVSDCENIRGLERKVVVVTGSGLSQVYGRLYAMSRCLSQLVLIN